MDKFKKEDIIEGYKEALEKFDTKVSDEKIVLFEDIQSKLKNEQTIKWNRSFWWRIRKVLC